MMTKTRTLAEMPDWISVEEAAQVSEYHPNYIRRLIRQGHIQAIKKGPMWWIDKISLQSYVDEMNRLGTSRFGPKKSQ